MRSIIELKVFVNRFWRGGAAQKRGKLKRLAFANTGNV